MEYVDVYNPSEMNSNFFSPYSLSHIFFGVGGSDDSKAQIITATIYILRKICFSFSAQHFHT